MLKFGFTTGSCAAAAAKASAQMIFEKKTAEHISIYTPKGIEYETEIIDACIDADRASCAVRKYSGDDPDVTNGMLIYACVELKKDGGIFVDGGEGIGRVTKAGLWQNIGEAAINKVPREMIAKEVQSVLDRYGYIGGANVIISAPEGKAIAEKTFNPRLGIVGGISILGTSGIVEPMSRQALIDAIGAELRVKRANEGNVLLLTPGNYGADFAENNYGIDKDKAVKCSNYIGAALDTAADTGFEKILLIGHIGKLVKLAGGIMDTHSRNADCRMEILAAKTALYCDNIKTVRDILQCTTTDAALDIIKDEGLLDCVMADITESALFHINKRLEDRAEAGIIIFSEKQGILGKSDNAESLIKALRGERYL